eukprot:3567841-Prymnesium_polylepis.1
MSRATPAVRSTTLHLIEARPDAWNWLREPRSNLSETNRLCTISQSKPKGEVQANKLPSSITDRPSAHVPERPTASD